MKPKTQNETWDKIEEKTVKKETKVIKKCFLIGMSGADLQDPAGAFAPLLLEHLEEDDVDERSGGQALEHRHGRTLELFLARGGFRQTDPDGDPERRDQRKHANVDEDQEISEPCTKR